MDRRSFLAQSTLATVLGAMSGTLSATERNSSGRAHDEANKSPEHLTSSDLSEYTTTLTADTARHLLRRSLFAGRYGEVVSATGSTAGAEVDKLLTPTPDPGTPSSWSTWINFPPPTPPFTDTQKSDMATQMNQIRSWWVGLMANTSYSAQEMMVLFWHNHFVSEATKVIVPNYMHIQNKLFRDNVFGNFKNLVKLVSKDSAMLIYLDGALNKKGRPNENYARELLELFTMGIGNPNNPNYSELDIQDIARALTGWQPGWPNSSFNSSNWDAKTKIIFLQQGTYDMDGAIDVIFAQRAVEISEFISKKIYKWFIYENDNPVKQPDAAIITAMGQTLRNNNWEIKPLLAQLLKSKHFFDTTFVSAKIKMPLSEVIGVSRQYNIDYTRSDVQTYLYQASALLGQIVLNPPDVRGWIGYRDWITTLTLPTRLAYSDSMAYLPRGSSTPLPYRADVIAFAKQFPDYNNATKLVKEMSDYLSAFPLSSNQLAALENDLTNNGGYDWNIDDPRAESFLRITLRHIMRYAEYQLV